VFSFLVRCINSLNFFVAEFISLFLFLVLGGVANMAPVLVKKIPILGYPLDGGMSLGGLRLLGDGKTVRGVCAGVIGAVLVGWLGWVLWGSQGAQGVGVWRFDEGEWLWFCAGIGLSALAGDAFKSLIKRRLGKKRGESWIPFDQVDWICGMLVFAVCTGHYYAELLYSLPLGIAGHFIIKWLGWRVGVENRAI
jgi:CDP-2,3-bis-(O-geranylgeranyl)-sn-glycerol synthase